MKGKYIAVSKKFHNDKPDKIITIGNKTSGDPEYIQNPPGNPEEILVTNEKPDEFITSNKDSDIKSISKHKTFFEIEEEISSLSPDDDESLPLLPIENQNPFIDVDLDAIASTQEEKDAIIKKDKREHFIALILLILTVVFWGYSFISTKIVLTEMPPSSIAFFRQIIALAVLLAWLIPAKKLPRVSVRDILQIGIASFFGIVLYFVFENTGLKFTNASSASMIVAAVPIITLISETLFFKLKVSFKIVACIILSIVGVYLVISVNGRIDFSSSTFFGNLLIMGAMFSWVVYTIMNKGFSARHSSLSLTTYQTITSIFLFLPFILSEAGSWKMLSLVPFLNLLYLGVFCSAFAYFFYIYAAKRLGPTLSSSFLNLIPVVTVILGYFVLGEKIAIIQVAGMGLIMLSLYKLTKKA